MLVQTGKILDTSHFGLVCYIPQNETTDIIFTELVYKIKEPEGTLPPRHHAYCDFINSYPTQNRLDFIRTRFINGTAFWQPLENLQTQANYDPDLNRYFLTLSEPSKYFLDSRIVLECGLLFASFKIIEIFLKLDLVTLRKMNIAIPEIEYARAINEFALDDTTT